MAKKKWNLYNLINRDKDRPDAVESPDVVNLTFRGFFKLFGRKLSTIISVDMMFVLFNFPAFFGLAIFIGAINDYSLSPQNLSFANIYGAMAGRNADPLTSVKFAISSSPITENEFNIPLLIVFIALTCLLLFTFGPVNCGCAHILRSAVRRNPIFLFKDFFGTIRKNLRQSIILGIFDLLFTVVLGYDILIFFQNYAYSFIYTVGFFFSLGVALIYTFARAYMYLLCITFDLSIFKIIKNSVIFAFLGFKRNFMALFGQIFMIVLIYLLISTGVLAALGIMLALMLYWGIALFMSYYASYKVVKTYMIDPYYDEDGKLLEKAEERPDTTDGEPGPEPEEA